MTQEIYIRCISFFLTIATVLLHPASSTSFLYSRSPVIPYRHIFVFSPLFFLFFFALADQDKFFLYFSRTWHNQWQTLAAVWYESAIRAVTQEAKQRTVKSCEHLSEQSKLFRDLHCASFWEIPVVNVYKAFFLNKMSSPSAFIIMLSLLSCCVLTNVLFSTIVHRDTVEDHTSFRIVSYIWKQDAAFTTVISTSVPFYTTFYISFMSSSMYIVVWNIPFEIIVYCNLMVDHRHWMFWQTETFVLCSIYSHAYIHIWVKEIQFTLYYKFLLLHWLDISLLQYSLSVTDNFN